MKSDIKTLAGNRSDSECPQIHDAMPHTIQSVGLKPNIPLKFSHFLRALECPSLLEGQAQERKLQLVQRCQKALYQWRESGYPDPGDWPDEGVDLLEYAYQQLIRVSQSVQDLPNNSAIVQT